ncbi:MAG: hypothetical protein GWN87_17915, partial [Desulfuromonadales bacterium]|nr:hypothetical protein [Desulfuromonadales bacterium]
LGEKLVLAVCDWAEIISMNCAMVFDESGRRASKKRRDMGTAFTAIIPLTRAEKSEIEMYIETLIPPPGIRTTFQGAALAQREPVKVFNVALPTVFENAEGQFRNTTRKTDVQIFEV